MATYTKNGGRQVKLAERQKVKAHVKAYNKILLELEDVADQLKNVNVEFDEDNINEYVKPIYGRDLDSMEKFLVLGKLHYKKDEDNA
jgi:hypothetical protein